MSFMDYLAKPLAEQGLVDPCAVQGCSDAEITALMQAQGVTSVPHAYYEFLRFGGRNPYWLTHSGEWDYDWLIEAKDLAREIVEDDNRDFADFEGSFVFQTHQGHMFYYFRPADLTSRDPHFWIYKETRQPEDSGMVFTEWLRELADSLPTAIAVRKRLGIE
ncbi:SMI1/KNR4 family protein [Nocardia cyriacigeorgica]|uniref:SMI1/KNR4 family protein n=1 Tax=Nocardia cyriacigeorgica TaxID=135487 RepID=UPI0018957123|nr:SMI1/KNR4 family protein [Nocardia cyriacigeorgica]MBF6289200.1 SMI1/KNR4 family protein [Nocardia cyriacigeorgica]